MFSHSRNLLITGGTYTNTGSHVEQHFHGTKARGIDVLLDASAPSAFHNSGERFDPPKCHPNTRTYILTKIMNWVVDEVGWDGLIMWLYGPAGAGKSAIAQTIAELCHARHLLLASFFFSRTDPRRNNEKCLIASIAYQITWNLLQARDAIDAAIDRDPAIFQRSVKAQLTSLIIDPLTELSKSGVSHSTPVPYLIIIDGLDECRDPQVQQHILRAVSSALQQPSVPLKFLICSRAEHHLALEFTQLMSGGIATPLSLDDGYEQDADIERYLIDSFHKISTTHPLKAYIPPEWPTRKVLSTLVQKSSGQFIYAATVVKYISSSRHQPTRRLEVVLGMQPPRNDLPFADLDALYSGILSSVEDIKATIQLLGVLILMDLVPKTPEVVGKFISLDPSEIQCALLDLVSVVESVDKDTEIRMLHASFPDFLLDRSRSKEYYIDSAICHAEIAQLCLSYIRLHASEKSPSCDMCLDHQRTSCPKMHYAIFHMAKHLSDAEPSADLREALLCTPYITSLIEFERTKFSIKINYVLADFLSFLKGSKFADAEELYLHHHSIWKNIAQKRIASFPLNLGFIICLVIIVMEPDHDEEEPDHNEEKITLDFTDYFPTVKDSIAPSYSTLYFGPKETSESSMGPSYRALLRELLRNPLHTGKHALDGPKCALAARFLLDCIMQPSCSEKKKFLHRYFVSHTALRLVCEVEKLLSKASYSDELVARINHTTLVCDLNSIPIWSMFGYRGKIYNWKEILQGLVKGVGDYLMRVVGSVPIGLHIILKEGEFERSRSYYVYDTRLG